MQKQYGHIAIALGRLSRIKEYTKNFDLNGCEGVVIISLCLVFNLSLDLGANLNPLLQ